MVNMQVWRLVTHLSQGCRRQSCCYVFIWWRERENWCLYLFLQGHQPYQTSAPSLWLHLIFVTSSEYLQIQSHTGLGLQQVTLRGQDSVWRLPHTNGEGGAIQSIMEMFHYWKQSPVATSTFSFGSVQDRRTSGKPPETRGPEGTAVLPRRIHTRLFSVRRASQYPIPMLKALKETELLWLIVRRAMTDSGNHGKDETVRCHGDKPLSGAT